VIDVGAPQIEHVRNVFGVENVGKRAAAFGGFVVSLPRHDHDRIGLAQQRQIMVVVEV